jgi:hypothetical protein
MPLRGHFLSQAIANGPAATGLEVRAETGWRLSVGLHHDGGANLVKLIIWTGGGVFVQANASFGRDVRRAVPNNSTA